MTDASRSAALSPLEPLRSGDPARALPVKQSRSEKTRDALLQTGTALLAAGGFDDVSIAQIAAASGCSVGAFYQRFQSKKAYFEFLLDRVVDQVTLQTQQTLTAESTAHLNLGQTIQACVNHHIGIVRTHEGLIRAALAYSMNGSDDWQPIGNVGAWLNAHYIQLIMPKSRQRDKVATRKRLLIGLHVIGGHLINVISHTTTVLPLHDRELPFWLGRMVASCMKAPSAGDSPYTAGQPSPQRAQRARTSP